MVKQTLFLFLGYLKGIVQCHSPCVRRLPRRDFITARNDDKGCLKNKPCHCEI
ncbi:MAG: hypothetical protein IJV35_03300 [Neisseriaceae bacterium]|nr:hypothetical protein [Neisseriaceae bacterium]